jgi:hypothetical protein
MWDSWSPGWYRLVVFVFIVGCELVDNLGIFEHW